MQGEFRGDFTRDTFDPTTSFLRVLMQQGRVQIDADWNEQIAILLRYLQVLAEDLIGDHGGPVRRSGFEILASPSSPDENRILSDFQIRTGRYYVSGILCENYRVDENGNKIPAISYYDQHDYPLNADIVPLPDLPFLVYLDVWERHITCIQDSRICEVALGGVDTAARSKLVWQVKTQPLGDQESDLRAIRNREDVIRNWSQLVELWQSPYRGLLKADARQDATDELPDPCLISPDARYRGAENQLYRVEIHRGGTADVATFKWSRENASVVFAIDAVSITPGETSTTALVNLFHPWRDDRFGLAVGDWVEIVDDDYTLLGQAEPLWQVEAIDLMELQVTLRGDGTSVAVGQSGKHPFLRRWDQKQGDPATGGLDLDTDGTARISEITATTSSAWLSLEDGVKIQFQPAPDNTFHTYRTGDYWLIPARTATGDVEWPRISDDPDGDPIALPPHGIHHHYAPLAVLGRGSYGTAAPTSRLLVEDCRRLFYALARTYNYVGSSAGIGSDLIWVDDD